MSLNPNASSFVPQMNPNANIFVPRQIPRQSSDTRRRNAAKNIQRRYRGNKSRNLTKRRNRPIDYDVQRKIINRYILDGELDELDDVDSRIEDLKETNKIREMLRKDRLADEYRKYPDRDEKLKRGKEEDRMRHRRAKTKRTIRAMRKDRYQRQDNIPTRVEAMTDAEQEDYLDLGSDDYNPVLEDGSSDEDLDSDDSEDMRMKRGLREDVDYYREQDRLNMEEMGPLYNDEYIQGDLERQLQTMKQMDPMRCKRVREMVEADPRLFKDTSFYDMYIRPCKDQTTRVYLDTFFNIDWRWIKPVGKRPVYPITGYGESSLRYGTDEYRKAMADYTKQVKALEIEDVINKIPGKFFPHSCKTALIDCLIELELLTTTNREYGSGPPFLKFDVLSNFFKWNKGPYGNRLSLRHLPYGSAATGTAAAPVRNFWIVSRGLSGREELERLFDLFRETVHARNLKHDVIIDDRKHRVLIDDDKIEQMIRYFILRLIGVVGNPMYIQQLKDLFMIKLKKYNDEFNVDPRLRESPEGLELYRYLKRLSSWMLSVTRYFPF